ncbi:hypothetical protein [Paenibacillus sp. sgz302251]|uniref:hypothetical protein n=1 Tax=Paenibacillus sp. sgz302251 TaxID=3414493 RepID=UPI003C7DAF15
MKRRALKWMVLGGALVIIIMYGIEMSSSGIERIYGPLDHEYTYAEQEQPAPAEDKATDLALEQQRKIAQLEQELEELKLMASRSSNPDSFEPVLPIESLPVQNERLPGIPYEVEQPAVNRIADSASGLLQSMSSEGIRLVVSIFDGLTK